MHGMACTLAAGDVAGAFCLSVKHRSSTFERMAVCKAPVANNARRGQEVWSWWLGSSASCQVMALEVVIYKAGPIGSDICVVWPC
jgi:hypothetical protein